MMAEFDFLDEHVPPIGGGAAPNGHHKANFKLVRARDVRLNTTAHYLVQGLIPREGLILVWGPPKCGKTFWVFDITMHIALGWLYRDRRVEPGTIVYIACEGERGLAARVAAFRQSKLSEADDPPFFLLSTRLDLPGQVDALILDTAAQIPDTPCAAIVLDTLNRSIRGSESRDEDMSDYVAAADALRERFKCAVIIIHHCGVDSTRPRGHTSLTGAVDAQIAIKRDATGKVITTLEWMKDGPEGDEFASQLDTVDIGDDENGVRITSCIVEPAEHSAKESTRTKRQLTPAAQIALDQLRNTLSTDGKIPPACNHIPPHTPTVDYDLWRRCCYSAGISSKETPDAKQKAFVRAAEKLIAVGAAAKWGEWVENGYGYNVEPGQTGQPDIPGHCPDVPGSMS
jgi:hypothetical protein